MKVLKSHLNHMWEYWRFHAVVGLTRVHVPRHSRHDGSRQTRMSAGLTDSEMGECRRGRMDGGARDEYWLISGEIDSWRRMGAFRRRLPGTPISLPSYAPPAAFESSEWFISRNAAAWCVYIWESFAGNSSRLFVGLDERNAFWYMKSVWNLIVFSIQNKIPLQRVCVHILIILKCIIPP